MKIRIKTELIELTIQDAPEHTGGTYTNHAIPETIAAIKAAVEQAVVLHNAVKLKKDENRTDRSTS